MNEFPCTEPVVAEIRIRDGQLEITAEHRDSATVMVEPLEPTDASRDAAARTTVELRGTKLVVHTPEISSGWLRRRSGPVRVVVALPAESTLDLRLASADAACHGSFHAITVNTASGDVMMGRVSGNVAVNTASGDARAEHIGGDLKVNTASGDVDVNTVGGAVQAHSASGHIKIARAGGNVRVNTASGDVSIGETSLGAVKINSASGDLRIGVATGTGVWMDITSMSGHARCELDPATSAGNGAGGTLSLHLRSMSGDILVHRA